MTKLLFGLRDLILLEKTIVRVDEITFDWQCLAVSLPSIMEGFPTRRTAFVIL